VAGRGRGVRPEAQARAASAVPSVQPSHTTTTSKGPAALDCAPSDSSARSRSARRWYVGMTTEMAGDGDGPIPSPLTSTGPPRHFA
jgi:hypothetical protein